MDVTDPGEIVFRNSRRKYVVVLVGSLAFTGIGAWLFARGDRDWSTWLGLALFGGIGIPIAIRALTDTRPRLVLNREGVMDRTLGVGVISWTEIVGAEMRSFFGQEFIALRLRDPKVFLERLSPMQRKLAPVAKAITSSELNLNLSGLPIRGREVISLIQARCQAVRVSRLG